MKRVIGFLQRWRKRLLGTLIVLVLVAIGAVIYAGGKLCAPAHHLVRLPKDFAVEKVQFHSDSGATLRGWLVVPPTNHGVVILQHGIRGDRGANIERARFLSAAGYVVLLYDFQAHGESTGEMITMGHLESRDSRAAVAFVKQRFPGKPIGVIGESLGAAAAALAQPPLEVQAVVMELMFPSLVEATKDRIEMRLGPLGRYLSPLLTSQVGFRLGCGVDELCPIERVDKMKMPKLFLAGTKDLDTKFSESQAIFARAADPKEFVPFEGARHQDLYRFAPDRYRQLILGFLGEHLK